MPNAKALGYKHAMARPEAAAKRKESGGRQISASLTADEIALLDKARETLGVETNKEALLTGLRLILNRGRMTRAELLAEIDRRLR